MLHSERPHGRTHVLRESDSHLVAGGGRAAALHRAERRSPAMEAAAAAGLLVLDHGVVPTARRSHTTGLGHVPMRPPRVSCQEVDPFAGGRSCCTWRGSCSKPLFRLSSWLERGCTLECFLSLTNQLEAMPLGRAFQTFFLRRSKQQHVHRCTPKSVSFRTVWVLLFRSP